MVHDVKLLLMIQQQRDPVIYICISLCEKSVCVLLWILSNTVRNSAFLGNCRKCNKMHRCNNSVQFHCLLIIIWTWPKSTSGQSYSPAAD